MDRTSHSKRLNAILRILIGVVSFFASGFSLLILYSISTNGLLGNRKKTLLQAIEAEPIIAFLLLFASLILIASIFSFITGILALGKNKNWDKELRRDLYFWISFVFISFPVITGFIAFTFFP